MGLSAAKPETPIAAMVTRLTAQKGFDLVMRVLDELVERGLCFMLLGTGEKEDEDFMRLAEKRHRGRVCSYIGYNEALAHRVYAGADLLLMPSRFEPCGLSQMIAMRYGTFCRAGDRRPQGHGPALQPLYRRGQRFFLCQLQRRRNERLRSPGAGHIHERTGGLVQTRKARDGRGFRLCAFRGRIHKALH